MTIKRHILTVSALVFSVASFGVGQNLPLDHRNVSPQASSFPSEPAILIPTGPARNDAAPSRLGAAPQPLFDFEESEIKFSLQSLMDTLRDRRHEGWVLTAYPDPKTSRPLIGAGFSLDVQATEHPQHDPLNPHPFLEPSAAQLWQAAGLEPRRLQQILDQYDRDLKKWRARRYRRKILARALRPEVTEEEATRLLRISAIQAVYNAQGYCRGFDQMTASQQMAISQLVFQMGINLEEFVQFLGSLNGDFALPRSPLPNPTAESEDANYWKTIQQTLIESQWARLYTGRASSVIALFDPNYLEDPAGARRRVEATLRPVAIHRRKGNPVGPVRAASYDRYIARKPHKGVRGSRVRRKVG